MNEVFELALIFFGPFFLVAVIMTQFTKKPLALCLGNMFMLAAVVLVVWAFVIDDGSRRGMEAFVLLLMFGAAGGSFLVGFVLRKFGVAQSRKKALPGEGVSKTEEPE
jgi:hypothetical protein